MTLTNYDPAIDPRDIETRKELIAGKETTEDMYCPDTNADPEGAARRSMPHEFGAQILETHTLSMTNIWGKPFGRVSVWDKKANDFVSHNFADGFPHLVPSHAYVTSIMEQHMADIPALKVLSLEAKKRCLDSEYYQAKITAMASATSQLQWREMTGNMDTLRWALAERAIAKYDYFSRFWSPEQDGVEESEYERKAEKAAADACSLLSEQFYLVQKCLEIQGKPEVNLTTDYEVSAVEDKIKLKLQKNAHWKDVTYRRTPAQKPTSKDWLELAKKY